MADWLMTESWPAFFLGLVLVAAAFYMWTRRVPACQAPLQPVQLDTLSSVREALLSKHLSPAQRPHSKVLATACEERNESSDRLLNEYLRNKKCEKEMENATKVLCGKLEEEKSLDLLGPLLQWAADLVCNLAMDRNLDTELAALVRLWREEESVNVTNRSQSNGYHVEGLEKLVTFLEETIAQHEETLDTNQHRDFVDYYLVRMKSVPKENVECDTLTKSNLVENVLDLLVVGSESLTKSLELALVTLAERPFLQDRIQQELDALPPGSEPTPLVQATVMEAIRQATPVPLVCLKNDSDTLVVEGCPIQKEGTLVANLQSVLMDSDLWQDPETFDPSRFLDQDGKIMEKEAYVPFSLGASRCPGETLAKSAITTALTSILRQFRLARPPPVPSEVEVNPINSKISVTRRQKIGRSPVHGN